MPITTLNKIVALFIMGTLPLLLLIIPASLHIGVFFDMGKFLEAVKELGAVLTILISLASLPIVVLLGFIVEGLASITIRPWIALSKDHYFLAVISFNRKGYIIRNAWEKKFSNLIKGEDHYEEFAVAEKNLTPKSILSKNIYGSNYDSKQSVASGIVLTHGSPEHISWIIQHYAAYVLASNFLFILLCSLVIVITVRCEGSWNYYFDISFGTVFAIFFLVIYSLTHIAIDRYLYTYDTTFRYASLYLAKYFRKHRVARGRSGHEMAVAAAEPKGVGEIKAGRVGSRWWRKFLLF